MKKYLILTLSLAGVLEISAQGTEKYRTDESIGQQLKNNKAPGLLYAPAQSSAPAQVQPHISMVEEIKNGKYGKVLTGGASVPAPSVAARSANQKLASDKSASQAEQPAYKAPVSPAVTIPSQGNVTEEATPPKAVPANELKRLPVKKDQQ